jgi:hypothetical protein
MSFECESSFIESIASIKSNASDVLIRDELKDELILWSKNDEMNKTQVKKTQKKFKKWWYLTSYEKKNVNLKNENKIRVMRWERINRTSDDWHNFIECARTTNEAWRLLCRRCDEDITHSSSMRARISAIKNHRKKIKCTSDETNKYSTSFMNSMIKISKMFSFLITFFHEHVYLFSRT